MILFVTGTDTGVGKTAASAWCAMRERESGKRVRYVKPVQTGLGHGESGSDADVVARMAGIEARELLRFSAPLAPSVAAEREGRTIDVATLRARILDCAHGVEVLIVEGAGGLLVPLSGETTMAELARDLAAPLLVVTRPGLGTLNHTALTLEAADRRGLDVAKILISGWPEIPGETERTNLEQLSRHGIPIATIPILPGMPAAPATLSAGNR